MPCLFLLPYIRVLFLCIFLLPRCYRFLPSDRGREFTINAEAAKGKPTGGGVVFISVFVAVALIFAPIDLQQAIILALTWLTMLTGFLDDRSITSWGEYKKGALDLCISLCGAFALYYLNPDLNRNGEVCFWLPFISFSVTVCAPVYIAIAVLLLWTSINTTNCTDGVDGLSSTLALIALITVGVLFYFVLGHKDIAAYLLVPHLSDGAEWAIITFSLAGVLMGYLWHNAYPSKVLMGDAGSRALGFFYRCGGYGQRQPLFDFYHLFDYVFERRNGTFKGCPFALFQNTDFFEYPLSASRSHAKRTELVAGTGTCKIYDYAGARYDCRFGYYLKSALKIFLLSRFRPYAVLCFPLRFA